MNIIQDQFMVKPLDEDETDEKNQEILCLLNMLIPYKNQLGFKPKKDLMVKK